MMEYPKINSLFKRDMVSRKLMEGDYSCEEFESIDRWLVTEKIDGTNVRICYENMDGASSWRFGGRTKDAQMPTVLSEYLQDTFDVFKFREFFPNPKRVILFGEGYGGKIQGNGWYRDGVGFILFDVWIDGWWLKVDDVADVAGKFKIPSVPLIANPYAEKDMYVWSKDDIVKYVKRGELSIAGGCRGPMEGIVARAYPQMLFRLRREQIMFKLKCKDFQ